MGTIVICVPALAGEIGMTRTLARGLQAAGHRVVYVGFASAVPLVRAAGFECTAMFGDWPIQPAAGWRAARGRARELDARLGALLTAPSNAFVDLLRNVRPDLVLVSSCVFENLLWAVLSLGAGCRTAYLTNNFDRSATAVTPPVSSNRLPSATAIGRAATWLTWHAHLAKREAAGHLRTSLGLSANWRGRIDAFIERFGLSRDLIDLHRVMPAFRLPELVPFPREFDFGPAAPSTYHYIGPCVDPDPPDVPFDWAALDSYPSRALIVCALGNLHHVARRDRERLLLAITDAARACTVPATFVIAAGDSLSWLRQRIGVASNVMLTERIPQTRLLARAALMITHGGSNSVRECLHFGVPMLVCPRWFDQFGIGARVRAHGLGLVCDPRHVTASRIEESVRRILSDPAFAGRAGRMRQHAQAYAQPELARRIIESWMHGEASTDTCQQAAVNG